MIAATALHAAIFGGHTHPCPCGTVWTCSDPYDCQPGPLLCPLCLYRRDEVIPFGEDNPAASFKEDDK